MYLIALCDDIEEELDQMERLLAAYWIDRDDADYSVQRFSSAEELLKKVVDEDYEPDLLLLDIIMSGKSGIEAAEEIRRRGCCTPIVFLTISKEYALDAYGVDAVQYLVKPLTERNFFHAMDIVLGQIRRLKENQIILKISGSIRKLRPDEIFYCESQKNYQILYLKEEECKIRMTAGELWGILEKFSQFGKCGRSFILNMNHIVSIERGEIFMDNKKTIYIPRNKTAELKQIYFSYYFEEKNDRQ